MKYHVTKIIAGRPYHYLDFRLTKRSDGKPVIISKYLGPSLPKDPNEALTSLLKDVGERSADLTDRNEASPFRRDSIKRMETTRFWYLQLQHDLFQSELDRFRRHFTVLFVLNSNRAEGSMVTRKDIERVMGKKAAPRSQVDLEAMNSIEAMAFAFSRDMRWSGPGIKKVHRLLFKELQPHIAGRYKRVDNIAGDGFDTVVSTTTPWKEVPGEVTALMRWFREARRRRVYPPWLAIELYWRFERVHPFEDGNGRVGRILMNAVLQGAGYMPVIFDAERTRAHSAGIGKAILGNRRPLASFFAEQTEWTVETILDYEREVQDGGWKHLIVPWWRTGRTRMVYDDVGHL